MIDAPLLTVGMPVFDAAAHLEVAIASVLEQDLADLELVVSDNASTDGTEAICRRAAAADPRVRYERQPVNRGAAWNFNRVAELARGRFFAWAAGDDDRDRDLLRRAVEVLLADPEVAVAHGRTVDVDDAGAPLWVWTNQPRTDDPTPHERLAGLLRAEHECFPVFGVMRTEALRATGMIGGYTESDRVLLVELALRGRFHEIGDSRFLHREHAGRSVAVHRHARDRTAWFDPTRSDVVAFPAWRLGVEYLRAVLAAPLPASERRRCLDEVLRWLVRHRARLARNVARVGVGLASRALDRRDREGVARGHAAAATRSTT